MSDWKFSLYLPRRTWWDRHWVVTRCLCYLVIGYIVALIMVLAIYPNALK